MFSNHSRDSYCNLPLEDVPTFYEALKKLDDLFRDPSNKFEYKMRDSKLLDLIFVVYFSVYMQVLLVNT